MIASILAVIGTILAIPIMLLGVIGWFIIKYLLSVLEIFLSLCIIVPLAVILCIACGPIIGTLIVLLIIWGFSRTPYVNSYDLPEDLRNKGVKR